MDNTILTRKTLNQVCVAACTDVFDLVGNTPLIPLCHVAADVQPAQVYAKAEWFNPSGSVKDRPAREIILTAEREGQLSPEVTLLDATSGNMGIAYAMLCASRGYQARLVIPQIFTLTMALTQPPMVVPSRGFVPPEEKSPSSKRRHGGQASNPRDSA